MSHLRADTISFKPNKSPIYLCHGKASTIFQTSNRHRRARAISIKLKLICKWALLKTQAQFKSNSIDWLLKKVSGIRFLAPALRPTWYTRLFRRRISWINSNSWPQDLTPKTIRWYSSTNPNSLGTSKRQHSTLWMIASLGDKSWLDRPQVCRFCPHFGLLGWIVTHFFAW